MSRIPNRQVIEGCIKETEEAKVIGTLHHVTLERSARFSTYKCHFLDILFFCAINEFPAREPLNLSELELPFLYAAR